MTIRPLIASVTALLAGSLVLAGCAGATGDAPSATTAAPTQAASAEQTAALLAEYGLTGMDAQDMIEHLDRLGGDERPSDLMASIRTDELLLAADGVETTLEMPEDSFYVSIAPYLTQTHDCFFHSLTTCQGELVGADVQVTVVDDVTGETVVDEETTTYENGFVGLWLPREMTGTLTVTHDGASVESPISTTADSATCLTTLKLA
ncbi:CueP family metal-binding protein [Sanguibacter suarezii]|uniref:CueP family metal-binding protein n=1 Tax=Sanguibacter suarezii TaxID=60921 RepID=UPI00082CC810|nr:CueP family metal-binding protein [Sanguibacter suarezii]